MLLHICVYFILSLGACSALECYVCHYQADNKDKCIKTTIQCRTENSVCMTRVRWSQPPFWVPRAERIHTVFKDCMDPDLCETTSRELSRNLTCKRDWFKDWDCFECCRGDRCNYYATMGASSLSVSLVGILSFLLVSLVVNWYKT